jgi:transcriptional regulator with XRE-family HTH domain
VLPAPDLLLLARRTAGLSQAELAQRLGRPRSTIARWELGEMAPAYDAVMEAIAACGLATTVTLANADSSYLHDVGGRLRLTPIERLRRLASERHVDIVQQLAERDADAIVIGDSAAALHGWPLLLDPAGDIEVCATVAAAEAVRDLDRVTLVEQPPGTRGYTDLRRDCELVEVPGGRVRVASPLDLLRIERARNHVVQAGAIEAVLEHRRRWPNGPPAPRQYTEQEANAAIEAWLTTT